MIGGRQAADALQVLVQRSIELCDFRCCLSCLEWEKERDICGKFKVRPPAKVIMFSCGENWNGDIPF